MLSGYYINLSDMKDRYKHFEDLKKNNPFFSNIKHFEAIKNKNGSLGCSMSHYRILNLLLEEIDNNKKEDYYMVCEDDFFIFNQDNFNEFEKNFNLIKDRNDWDLITLTPRGKTMKNDMDAYSNSNSNTFGFKRITETQTTTAYIIKRKFIPTLMENLHEGITNMITHGKTVNKNNTCDQCWKKLQTKYVFLYHDKVFGGQLPGYSTIEGTVVDYNKRFMNQANY